MHKPSPKKRSYPEVPKITIQGLIMAADQDRFYQLLGQNIARLRKEKRLTQTQLAEVLGISQQHMLSFEKGRRRPPIAALPKLSDTLAVSVEEILGLEHGNGKRGPTPKIQKQLERIQKLPRGQQNLVRQMLDGICNEAGV